MTQEESSGKGHLVRKETEEKMPKQEGTEGKGKDWLGLGRAGASFKQESEFGQTSDSMYTATGMGKEDF